MLGLLSLTIRVFYGTGKTVGVVLGQRAHMSGRSLYEGTKMARVLLCRFNGYAECEWSVQSGTGVGTANWILR